MSWETLEGNSRRPRVSWVAPNRLREKPRHGISIHPPPLDPDALLDYIDNAISVTEYARATRHLSLLFPSSLALLSPSSSPSSSSSSSSSSLSLSSLSSTSAMTLSSAPSLVSFQNFTERATQPLFSARKVSRHISNSQQRRDNIHALPKDTVKAKASILDLPSMSEMDDVHLLEDDTTDGPLDVKEEGNDVKLDKPLNDAQAADDAYRAACSALSEGHAEMALPLLHLASAKCPPDKHIALGKVRRLMLAAMQLVKKNSAVLSSLPADKDTC